MRETLEALSSLGEPTEWKELEGGGIHGHAGPAASLQ